MRLLIVGNIAGGKTVLARRLAAVHKLPLTHVDSIQFLPGMSVRPHQQTQDLIDEIVQKESWLIDGFGPLNKIEERFQRADKIIFVDLPVSTHVLWLIQRQIKNIWSPRAELPEGCSELTIKHTSKLFKTLWRIHKKMRPELLKIFGRPELKQKVIFITNRSQWNSLFRDGVTKA